MSQYLALMHHEPGSDYGVSFPDFPGCVTAGRTPEEARRMAQEALSGHIEAMLAAGLRIPQACRWVGLDTSDAYETFSVYRWGHIEAGQPLCR